MALITRTLPYVTLNRLIITNEWECGFFKCHILHVAANRVLLTRRKSAQDFLAATNAAWRCRIIVSNLLLDQCSGPVASG